MKREVFNTGGGLSLSMLDTLTPTLVEPALELESPRNYKDTPYGNRYSGYFKAPATAKYRFLMACDDNCRLSLSSVHMDRSAKTVIKEVSGAMSYRSYISMDYSRATNWIDLVKDELYYIDAKHINSGGPDHLTVSVEIEDPTIVDGHHHTVKEV